MSENANESFFQLTPERVLLAVESHGMRCTGRCLTLNSFENRVYDVELEPPEETEEGEEADPEVARLPHAMRFRRIVKFYRPGRWSSGQILEEHRFLQDLVDAEIPVVAPLKFPDGGTLRQDQTTGIYFALFSKAGGRSPDELSDDQLMQLGRLLARMHQVGAQSPSPHRVKIGPQTYALEPLDFLVKGNWLPLELKSRYIAVVQEIVKLTTPWFEQAASQRLHGDCHFGNLLWGSQGAFFLDFDDMVMGPPVQDMWLIAGGRDAEGLRQREVLLEGYEMLRTFDRTSLRLIEPLRALRFVHYAAWLARRWKDPAFPVAFPEFNTHRYWLDETTDLEEQLRHIQGAQT